MESFNSDSESDYSMLESPRPSAQARMLAAMIQGQLTELVLRGGAQLSRSIGLCLEVLGMGTSPPEHQRAAAKEIIRLATHRKLRPAVDNLLVMRRLCRIIELTESATALEQVGEALFAIADDAAWQTKGGSTAEVLREALIRCVPAIGRVAKTATVVQDGVESGTETPATSETAPTMNADQTALAVAAAVMFRPSVLHLLDTAQLVEAARALGACIACGCNDGNVLSALTAVVKHGPTDEDRVDVGGAALGCQGMVAALLKAVALGTQTIPLSQDAEHASGCGEGANSIQDGASGAPMGGSSSSGDAGEACSRTNPIQLTTSAQVAFLCLKHVLDACSATRQSIMAAVALDEAAAALLPLLQLADDEAARALHALLILTALTTRADVCPNVKPVTAAFGAGNGQPHIAPAAVLRAANVLLNDGAARDFSDGVCATALLRLVAVLLGDEKLTVEQLLGGAAGLILAASGVILGKAPEVTWCGLFTSVTGQVGSTAATSTATQYPEALTSAAVELATLIMEWMSASWQDDNYDEALWDEVVCLLRPADIANTLIASLTLNEKAADEQGAIISSERIWCIAYSMCFSRPQPSWVASNMSELTIMIMTLQRALTPSRFAKRGSTFQRKVLQLAVMLVLCLWSGAIIKRCASNNERKFVADLLRLITAALQCAVTVTTGSPETMPQMALVAGVLNAAVGLLRHDLILTESASKMLSPALPCYLLHLPAAAGGQQSAPANLLKLYNSLGSSRQKNRSGYGTSNRPKMSMQLQWAFEKLPPQPDSWEEIFFNVFSELRDFGTMHTTVAASTAQPLLQAMCSASSRLSELLQLHMEEMAADKQQLETADERLNGGALLSSVYRVLGNTAKVLGQCIPQGMVEIK
ncbi:hypothetical protein Vafri_17137 [Volvox africanus]|uniref:Uncharacterized protein n=1 Tax=Volvox africanus TaxID=51714 RepID=A0A8J4BJS9_9CHLO|nr:hypothetical protein Vafri_17137 [Volvox africanus]